MTQMMDSVAVGRAMQAEPGSRYARTGWRNAYIFADQESAMWLTDHTGRRIPWRPHSVDLRARDWYRVTDIPLLGS